MFGSPAAARNDGQPVLVGDDAVHHRARLDLARPADEGRNAPATFPVGVLLAPEGRDARVRPGVVVDAVVGRVHDDGVLGDAELVDPVEHLPDELVVGDHHVVVVALAALALVLRGAVGPEVHGGGVVPEEERLLGLGRVGHEAERVLGDLLVDGLHPLLGERPGVLDLLPALAVRPAVEHAAGTEALLELRVLRVVRVLGLLLGVQVVEVAEELVEAVHGGQELVLVAQVVLPELAGGVAERLQELGDGRVLRAEAQVGPRHPDLGEAGADGVLAGDEGGASRGAALLGVVVGEGHALVGHAVDVGRAVAHLPAAVVADVPPAHVVAPENEDVRLAGLGHRSVPFLSSLVSTLRLLLPLLEEHAPREEERGRQADGPARARSRAGSRGSRPGR